MSIGLFIQGWRLSRNQSIESLSDAAGIPTTLLEQIEVDQADPTTSTIEALASALRIPPSWLFDNPQSFKNLFTDSADDEEPDTSQINPVTDRILAGSHADRSLYVLLTTLMQARRSQTPAGRGDEPAESGQTISSSDCAVATAPLRTFRATERLAQPLSPTPVLLIIYCQLAASTVCTSCGR